MWCDRQLGFDWGSLVSTVTNAGVQYAQLRATTKAQLDVQKAQAAAQLRAIEEQRRRTALLAAQANAQPFVPGATSTIAAGGGEVPVWLLFGLGLAAVVGVLALRR